MNKLVYYVIGAIWAILFAIVGFSIWAAPDFDVLRSLQQYKTVGQYYLDKKQINPDEVAIDGVDDEFVKIYAQYMRSFQDSENAYNAQSRLLKVVLEPQNLANATSLKNAYSKLQALNDQTTQSYEMLVRAEERAKRDLAKLNQEDMEVYQAQGAIDLINTEYVEFRDNVTRQRLAIEKYYKAILDFLNQEQGNYIIQYGQIKFEDAEKTTYYAQLLQGLKKFERELRKSYEEYRVGMREVNAEIPVDVK